MDKLKSALNKAKDVVKNNKAALAAGFVAIGAIALQQRNRKEFDAFLDEKGIDRDEYYNPEYYEEKKQMEELERRHFEEQMVE